MSAPRASMLAAAALALGLGGSAGGILAAPSLRAAEPVIPGRRDAFGRQKYGTPWVPAGSGSGPGGKAVRQERAAAVIRRLVADPADLLAAAFGLCLAVGLLAAGAAYSIAANAEAMGAAIGMLAAGATR